MFQDFKLNGSTGRLKYYPMFLNDAEALCAMRELEGSLPWETQDITLFGKTYKQPRLICSLAKDSSLTYSYSNQLQVPHDWNEFPVIVDMKNRIEDALSLQHDYFNLALCNLYRNGNDSMGYHADDERGLCSTIASLSLGAERDFIMKPRRNNTKVEKKERIKFLLTNGSLLVMMGSTQKHWLHSVPKRAKVATARINITFRRLNSEKQCE